MRKLIFLLFLLVHTVAFSLTLAERVSLLGLCELAIYEAKEGNEELIPYAANCLLHRGRVKEALKLLGNSIDARIAKIKRYLLAQLSVQLSVAEPSAWQIPFDDFKNVPVGKLKELLSELKPEVADRVKSYLVRFYFYNQNYRRFFELLDAFPKLNRETEVRRLLALAYYRTGQWDFAMAVLSPMEDSFGLYWKWKIKSKLGLGVEKEERDLSRLPANDFYRVMFSLKKGLAVKRKISPLKQELVCEEALWLQEFGLDGISLEALKECMEKRYWYGTIPLLPNPFYGVRLLWVDKRLGKDERFRYSYLRPYGSLVRLCSWAYGVDEDLVYAVMRQESLFDRFALSSSDAMGLMQIIPKTALWISQRLGDDPEIPKYFFPFFSIKYGTWYLSHLSEKFPAFLAVAAYNSGPTAVSKWLSENQWVEDASDVVAFYPVSQTRNYVRKVTVNFFVYRYLLENKR